MQPLTEKQQQNFAATNVRLGLKPDEYTVQNLPKSGNVVFSSDPSKSFVAPRFIGTASIAHLKELMGHAGVPDDANVSYPPALQNKALLQKAATVTNKTELMQHLSGQDMDDLRQAASAYLVGNSEKVAEYEPLINAVMFPGRVAVFAGENLVVPAGQTYVINGNDPVVLNYGSILVETGGQIKIEVDTNITTQIFTQQ